MTKNNLEISSDKESNQELNESITLKKPVGRVF